MSEYEILIGEDLSDPDFTFTNDVIYSSPNGELSVDAIGDEMAIDTINFSVFYDNDASGVPKVTNIKYGTPVVINKDDTLFAKMYFKSISRSGKKTWRIETMSYVGILDRQYSYGGLYENQKFKYIVNDILTIYTPKYQMLDGFYGSSHEEDPSYDLQYSGAMAYRNYTENYTVSGLCFSPSRTGVLSSTSLIFDLFFKIDFNTDSDWATQTESDYNRPLMTIFSSINSYAFSHKIIAYNKWESGVRKNYIGAAIMNGSSTSASYIRNISSYGNTTGDFKFTYDYRVNMRNLSVYTKLTSDPDNWTLIANWGIPSTTFEGTSSIFVELTDCDRILKFEYARTYSTVSGSQVMDSWYPVKYLYDNTIKYAMYNVDYNSSKYWTGRSIYLIPGNNVNYDKETFVGYSIPDPEDLTITYGPDYSGNGNVGDITLSGWLGIDTKRNNLHKAMVAAGVVLEKDLNGNWYFRNFKSETETTTSISASITYNDGYESINPTASGVEVTEHDFSYISDVEDTVLFDNTDSYTVSNYYVTFSNPVEISSIYSDDDLKIIGLHCNYAVVTGRGVLKGKQLIHSERVISKESEEEYYETNVNQLTDVTLVNKKNSQNVLWRLHDYYIYDRKIGASIVYSNEKIGKKYGIFNSTYHYYKTGYLTKMSLTGSNSIKASCELLEDKSSSHFTNNDIYGNNYSNYVVLTGTGTWAVPQSVRNNDRSTIHVIVIGGGCGGDSGYAGETGGTGVVGDNGGNNVPTMWYDLSDGEIATPGEGGSGGAGGKGGRIFEKTILHDDILASYSYICGSAGSGGAQCSSHDTNNPGSYGVGSNANTKLYSGSTIICQSSDGTPSPYGVRNIFTNEVYAKPGEDGYYGFRAPVLETYYDTDRGDSSTGHKKLTYFYNYSWGINKINYKGREIWRSGKGYYAPQVSSSNLLLSPSGGGPAVGANGSDSSGVSVGSSAGNGGAGGDARARAHSLRYGNGGNGGHGGGGGGVGGGEITVDGVSYFAGVGTGGAGGKGGAGGNGAPGCIIIYY